MKTETDPVLDLVTLAYNQANAASAAQCEATARHLLAFLVHLLFLCLCVFVGFLLTFFERRNSTNVAAALRDPFDLGGRRRRRQNGDEQEET